MPDPANNFYAILGVARDASQAEIRQAYHEQARRMHPDVNPSPRASEQFLQIQEAFDILSQPDKRAVYDQTLPGEEKSETGILVSSLYSRSMLARISEPQLIYVLLEFRAAQDVDTSSIPPMNVCLVLDRSTSMQGLRLDTLKSTARELIRQFRSQDYLSIVTFSDRAEVLVPATRGSDYEKIEARISLLQAGGGTEIYQGLKEGAYEITRNLNPSYLNQMILITDGRTYGDEAICLELADQVRDQGITVSCMGIGTEWNDEFMDQLVSKTGGNSVYVASAEDIRTFLEGKFKEMEQIYAEGLMLEYSKRADIEIKYAFRLDPELGPILLENPLRFGSLPRNKTLSVLLEFLVSSVPTDASNLTLIEGDIRMSIPTRIVPTTTQHLRLQRKTSGAIDPEPPPQRIVKAMSRLTLYRMQEHARKDLAEGNIEAATRRLQNLATHLLAQGEHKLARAVLAEADRVQQGNSISEQGEKRIKYGTRALLLPHGLEDLA